MTNQNTPGLDAEREVFEKWYATADEAQDEPDRVYELDEDGMNELTKGCLWEGWMARSRLATTAPMCAGCLKSAVVQEELAT